MSERAEDGINNVGRGERRPDTREWFKQLQAKRDLQVNPANNVRAYVDDFCRNRNALAQVRAEIQGDFLRLHARLQEETASGVIIVRISATAQISSENPPAKAHKTLSRVLTATLKDAAKVIAETPPNKKDPPPPPTLEDKRARLWPRRVKRNA